MPDEYSFSDSVHVDASPRQVYDTVSDVTRHGEWSVFTTRATWESGDGPAVGARFTGDNSRPGRDWQTRSEVVVAEPGREFAWVVGDGRVRWAYELAPEDGGTRLTQRWDFLEAGRDFVRQNFGEEGVALRTDDAHASIPTTLAAIKRVVEG